MCQDIAYNETIFPNLMGQLTQDIAGQHMAQYVPLIKGRAGALSNCLFADKVSMMQVDRCRINHPY